MGSIRKTRLGGKGTLPLAMEPYRQPLSRFTPRLTIREVPFPEMQLGAYSLNANGILKRLGDDGMVVDPDELGRNELVLSIMAISGVHVLLLSNAGVELRPLLTLGFEGNLGLLRTVMPADAAHQSLVTDAFRGIQNKKNVISVKRDPEVARLDLLTAMEKIGKTMERPMNDRIAVDTPEGLKPLPTGADIVLLTKRVAKHPVTSVAGLTALQKIDVFSLIHAGTHSVLPAQIQLKTQAFAIRYRWLHRLGEALLPPREEDL